MVCEDGTMLKPMMHNGKTGGPNGSIRNEEEYTHGANSGLKISLDLCGVFFFSLLPWIRNIIDSFR